MLSRESLFVATIFLACLAQSTVGFATAPKPAARYVRTSSLQNDCKVAASMTSSIHSSFLPEDGEPFATAVFMSSTKQTDDNDNQQPLRSRLRRATGFSLTAFRRTMRAATGISLTAIYASTLAATSKWVRTAMALILSFLPPSFRYFLQPFLILYYAPLFILRSLTGPTGKKARESHEVLVDSFKAAVDAAEKKADGYWPVHVNGRNSSWFEYFGRCFCF